MVHILEKDTRIDFGIVMCAPFMSMVDFDYKIKVKPSGKKNDKGRKKTIELIISKFLKMKHKLPISKDFIKLYHLKNGIKLVYDHL